MPAVLSSVRETHSRADSKKFVYDQVSGRDGTQEGIFESVGKPMCESVLQGYNATIFAYGQTGAGKTFTMMGSGEGAEGENKGLIQRVFDYLFQRIGELETGEGKVEISCKCSYLEIYNEQVLMRKQACETWEEKDQLAPHERARRENATLQRSDMRVHMRAHTHTHTRTHTHTHACMHHDR